MRYNVKYTIGGARPPAAGAAPAENNMVYINKEDHNNLQTLLDSLKQWERIKGYRFSVTNQKFEATQFSVTINPNAVEQNKEITFKYTATRTLGIMGQEIDPANVSIGSPPGSASKLTSHLVYINQEEYNILDAIRRDLKQNTKVGGYRFSGTKNKFIYTEFSVIINPYAVEQNKKITFKYTEGSHSKEKINPENIKFGSPFDIHVALKYGNLGKVMTLKEQGIDIYRLDPDKNTALHLASRSRNLDMVRYLVSQQAIDIQQENDKKQTALHMVIWTRHFEIIKYLVEHKININAIDFMGKTALDLSVGMWKYYRYSRDDINYDIIRFLIQNGADITPDTFNEIHDEELKNEFIELAARSQINWIEQAEDHVRDFVTLALYEDPLIASDGFTYSRSTLEILFENAALHNDAPPKSPMNRNDLLRLNGLIGIPNIAMQQMVNKYNEHKLKISQGGYKLLN